MQAIDLKLAKEYVLANYPLDPLLRQIALNLLEQLPKVETVEVVRCKECAYSTGTAKFCPLYRDGLMKDDDYCSVARRK